MRSRHAWARALVVGLLTTIALPIVTTPARAATARWDPRVLSIAREVEALRGLKFERPVPVDFLPSAAFDRRLGKDRGDLSPADRAQLERSEAQLRAIGLLPPGVDLLSAQNALLRTSVAAFYDPATKRATVRGDKLTPVVEVTLAHELTHALQDQHFDLLRLQRAAARNHATSALTALAEGDAVRVQLLYADKLSARDHATYERARERDGRAERAALRAAGIPDSLVVMLESPYDLGPSMLQLVGAVDGRHAIDALFRSPPTSDSSYLTPTTLVDGSHAVDVTPPVLQPGETAVGTSDVFGSFALYLMLAARSDPVHALGVADGWAGDAEVTFTRAGTTCLRAAFAGRSADATTAIEGALEQWAAQAPAGSAQAAPTGDLAGLTACDPGVAGVTASDGSLAALAVATVRNLLIGTLADQGVGTEVAACTANGVVADPAFHPVLDAVVADPSAEPNPKLLGPVQQSLLTNLTRCRVATK